MGCNCKGSNKTHSTRRTYPFTPQGRKAQAEKDARTAREADDSKDSGTSGTTTTTQEFALISPSGSMTTYGSRLEADAARVRAGYRGTVRRV